MNILRIYHESHNISEKVRPKYLNKSEVLSGYPHDDDNGDPSTPLIPCLSNSLNRF